MILPDDSTGDAQLANTTPACKGLTANHPDGIHISHSHDIHVEGSSRVYIHSSSGIRITNSTSVCICDSDYVSIQQIKQHFSKPYQRHGPRHIQPCHCKPLQGLEEPLHIRRSTFEPELKQGTLSMTGSMCYRRYSVAFRCIWLT